MTLTRRRVSIGSSSLFVAASLPRGVRADEVDFPIPKTEARLVPYKYRRREVEFETTEPVGTIVVDSRKFYLYYVLGNGRAIRYGIGVGHSGARWQGEAVIARKAKWPVWTPSEEMMAKHKLYQRYKDGMPGGPDNPLGARALYLLNDGVDNLIRIHGTPDPETIGKAATSGCFRMLNTDVTDLYARAEIGTRVVVLQR